MTTFDASRSISPLPEICATKFSEAKGKNRKVLFTRSSETHQEFHHKLQVNLKPKACMRIILGS
jgi:hypothetical protein